MFRSEGLIHSLPSLAALVYASEPDRVRVCSCPSEMELCGQLFPQHFNYVEIEMIPVIVCFLLL